MHLFVFLYIKTHSNTHSCAHLYNIKMRIVAVLSIFGHISMVEVFCADRYRHSVNKDTNKRSEQASERWFERRTMYDYEIGLFCFNAFLPAHKPYDGALAAATICVYHCCTEATDCGLNVAAECVSSHPLPLQYKTMCAANICAQHNIVCVTRALQPAGSLDVFFDEIRFAHREHN